jgi:hypothetical protein
MPRLVRRGSSTEGRRRRLASCSELSSSPEWTFLIDVPDLDTALDWAARMPHAAYGTAEVRAVRTGMAWQAALG